MSRIGKRPVPVPANVQATVDGQTIKVKGPKGELSLTLPEEIKLAKTADGISVEPREDTKRARSMWGMSRTLIDNQIKGVVNGYARTLEIQGVGFRAQLKGKDLNLQLGFSHEINYKVPADIDIKLAGPKQEQIQISGIDKQKVGQVAAEIRGFRPPEPYQGKGVRYQGEYILRKEGKKK
ncbi:MAG TPA: 50S ribosomal protein L6 [Hyphomicrobiaceae bacterium]|jgi:large subunit ribosomal protein L6|nr:50S ribosomal protein L6 [Hyphomicrobiaceae bacterium]